MHSCSGFSGVGLFLTKASPAFFGGAKSTQEAGSRTVVPLLLSFAGTIRRWTRVVSSVGAGRLSLRRGSAGALALAWYHTTACLSDRSTLFASKTPATCRFLPSARRRPPRGVGRVRLLRLHTIHDPAGARSAPSSSLFSFLFFLFLISPQVRTRFGENRAFPGTSFFYERGVLRSRFKITNSLRNDHVPASSAFLMRACGWCSSTWKLSAHVPLSCERTHCARGREGCDV